MMLLVVNDWKMVSSTLSIIFPQRQPHILLGRYQIGVHIADVSYFVREQSPLDVEASQRTTSVYLVERVKSIHEILS